MLLIIDTTLVLLGLLDCIFISNLQTRLSCVLQKPGMDLADTYITFVRQNQDILRDRISDELYIEKLFEVSFFFVTSNMGTLID